jgi:hypothetical protein
MIATDNSGIKEVQDLNDYKWFIHANRFLSLFANSGI